jgi:hypothetical protein
MQTSQCRHVHIILKDTVTHKVLLVSLTSQKFGRQPHSYETNKDFECAVVFSDMAFIPSHDNPSVVPRLADGVV